MEEYLHDYLLEDMLVTVSLCRLIWKTPLHFEDKIYTDLHYSQIQWDYLKGKILLSYSKELEMQLSVLVMLQHWAKTEQESSVPSREEVKEYIPKPLQSQISTEALQNHLERLL